MTSHANQIYETDVGPIRRKILPTQRFVANDIQAIFRASEGFVVSKQEQIAHTIICPVKT